VQPSAFRSSLTKSYMLDLGFSKWIYVKN